VQYFDVDINAMSGRYNSTSMGALRLPIASYATCNVCPPLQVSVSATNAIGTNLNNFTLTSEQSMWFLYNAMFKGYTLHYFRD
jgi:hypothetical protein